MRRAWLIGSRSRWKAPLGVGSFRCETRLLFERCVYFWIRVFFSRCEWSARETANSTQSTVALRMINATDQEFVLKRMTLHAMNNNHLDFYFA